MLYGCKSEVSRAGRVSERKLEGHRLLVSRHCLDSVHEQLSSLLRRLARKHIRADSTHVTHVSYLQQFVMV